jgi:hypothetical protein
MRTVRRRPESIKTTAQRRSKQVSDLPLTSYFSPLTNRDGGIGR